ncbi:ankyrin repeat domain-containing protein [Tahibacter soli]|uniref:Ankyrin repeat domain-containing protein n=1 Tax=Tahibacter soli TaxID=2983605 RepID=A0A9X4BIB4_9GAMM|nr:ankyrin repeat domain-containing protein [Tahibacter soli]MDC8010934.1 ankyrin repeat domain-containing protein [Tahibacter soli]
MLSILEITTTMLWAVAITAAPETPPIPECRPDQLLGYVPSDDEVASHREGSIPPVEYDRGDGPGHLWGFEMALRINANGNVDCYRLVNDFGKKAPLNRQRRNWLEKLADVRYRPFADGRSAAAIVTENVREVERVESTASPVDVPLDQFVIGLERTACFGSCPSYTVEIRGDGSVTYKGRAFVDVEGEHRYRIPTAEVARLVESMHTKNIWSSKTEYIAPITDNPSQTVTIKAGERSHRIHDYVGEMVGMPVAISEFEREIDAAAKTDRWIRLSVETVDLLDQEGFDFASPEGTALLWRSVAEREGDSDKAVLRLLQRGARDDGKPSQGAWRQRTGTLLDIALENGKAETADALIANGALETRGQIDRAKVDAAFRAAIKGARLASVQRVWSAANAATPSLEFDDEDESGKQTAKRVPVTLLLEKPYGAAKWEGLKIAQWLAAQGCDLHAAAANGDTLLHRAAGAGDVAFVRYLLEEGADASTPGKYGLPALGGAANEDVAMLLLDAGSDLSKLSDHESSFREYATSRHWSRVVAWLDEHKQ